MNNQVFFGFAMVYYDTSVLLYTYMIYPKRFSCTLHIENNCTPLVDMTDKAVLIVDYI